ncbi:hypothetical protein GCM10011506_15270 [Marivirga lumbricoides]|uniref:Co-chaperone DjlA N-terminal domain-containing protein n=1 Tax=Marivirga lumbricoides TaxID=1046115 RepID=A0ABQ1LYQ9_9BACT|nr:hypothetical protein GCM10011506_15270 [Marivirga lumbricoides]
MDKQHIFKQYQEFIIFLLVHIANSDFTIKGAEIEVIISKMEDYFPDIEDLDKLRSKFVNIQEAYESLNDGDINHLIYHNYLTFKDTAIHPDRIVNDLQEVILADGLIHERETQTFESIKKLLDIKE